MCDPAWPTGAGSSNGFLDEAGPKPGPPEFLERELKKALNTGEESMRGFLARALERAGYDVIAYDNGADAFARLKEEPFTLLLTDIVMPRMDGIELARRASELDPDLKIMFITGFAAVTLNSELQAPKDARVLSKPFHLKDLVNEIDKLLAA